MLYTEEVKGKSQINYKRRPLELSVMYSSSIPPSFFRCRAMAAAGTSVSDHGFLGYKLLNETEENGSWRTFSRRKRGPYNTVTTSLSYKQERAKKRLIFLQSYKFATMDDGDGGGGGGLGGSCRSTSCKLIKRVMIKVKAVAVSIVSISRIGSLKSCNSPSAICASTPTSTVKCF